jgi:hypothetical protein
MRLCELNDDDDDDDAGKSVLYFSVQRQQRNGQL